MCHDSKNLGHSIGSSPRLRDGRQDVVASPGSRFPRSHAHASRLCRSASSTPAGSCCTWSTCATKVSKGFRHHWGSKSYLKIFILSNITIRYGLDHGFVVPLLASATTRLGDRCETIGICGIPNQWVGQCLLITPLLSVPMLYFISGMC